MPTTENTELINTITALKAISQVEPQEIGSKTVSFKVDSDRPMEIKISVYAGPYKKLEEFIYCEMIAVAPQVVKTAVRKYLEVLQYEIKKQIVHCKLRLNEMENTELPFVEEALKDF